MFDIINTFDGIFSGLCGGLVLGLIILCVVGVVAAILEARAEKRDKAAKPPEVFKATHVLNCYPVDAIDVMVVDNRVYIEQIDGTIKYAGSYHTFAENGRITEL
jgi:hypothetical protein